MLGKDDLIVSSPEISTAGPMESSAAAAIFVARRHPQLAAQAILSPVVEHAKLRGSDPENRFLNRTLIFQTAATDNPQEAVELIDQLPEAEDLDRTRVKNMARLAVAKTLLTSDDQLAGEVQRFIPELSILNR